MRALTVRPGRAGSGAVRGLRRLTTLSPGLIFQGSARFSPDGTKLLFNQLTGTFVRNGAELLVIGHESFGRVSRDAGSLKAGTPVVASVRRPDGCPNCRKGEPDMCLWGGFLERGITRLDGFCAERGNARRYHGHST